MTVLARTARGAASLPAMDPVTGLSLGRIGLGIASLVAPSASARLFGIDAVANPQLGAINRMFGAREIALGAVTLASRGTLRRNMVLVGMAVDAADAASAGVEVAGGGLPKLQGSGLAAVAASAVATGVAALALSRGK